MFQIDWCCSKLVVIRNFNDEKEEAFTTSLELLLYKVLSNDYYIHMLKSINYLTMLYMFKKQEKLLDEHIEDFNIKKIHMKQTQTTWLVYAWCFSYGFW